MKERLKNFAIDNIGIILLLLAFAVLFGVVKVGNAIMSARPQPPRPPTAETKFVVTVMCNGGFLNTKAEYFSTNHPDGDGPAFDSVLLTTEVNSFSAEGCLQTTVGQTRVWSSVGPFGDNVYHASQEDINRFLADEAALGH